MALVPVLPRQQSPLIDQASFPRGEWYDFFRLMNDRLADGTLTTAEVEAAIRAIAIVLGSPDGTVANIPPLNFLPKTTTVTGSNGVDVDGSLAEGGVDLSINWSPVMARISLRF